MTIAIDRGLLLARFRADPRKVRVGVRRSGLGWLATVSSREAHMHGGFVCCGHGMRADGAVRAALAAADLVRLDGVDIDMSWSYEHPWGAEGVRRAEAGLGR